MASSFLLPTSTLSTRQRWLFIAISAVLWWLAGAFSIAPLGWVALAPFYVAVWDLELRERFRLAYAGGFCCFWLINWWLVPTITGGAPAIGASALVGFPLSVVAVTIIAAVHGFQPALVSLFASRRWWAPLAMALAWTALDWLRCQTIIAHSWGALAFAQTSDLPLLQVASLVGQHGLTFLCIFCSLALASFWKERHVAPLVAAILLMLGAHDWGWQRLRTPFRTAPLGKVLLVQTNVSSLSKTVGTGETPFQQAYRLTALATKNEKFDLIVWPETTCDWMQALPRPTSTSGQKLFPGGLEWSQWQLLDSGSPLLTGAQTVGTGENGELLRFNDAALIEKKPSAVTPASTNPLLQQWEVTGRAKERLVPFGERAPFSEWLPFLKILAPQPEVARRPNEGPLAWKSTHVAPLICFESCFPQPANRLCRDVGLLVVITNDEWFAGTEAPRQHRAMSVLRAVENGVPLVQVANGGISTVADTHGQILAQIPYGEAKALAYSFN